MYKNVEYICYKMLFVAIIYFLIIAFCLYKNK